MLGRGELLRTDNQPILLQWLRLHFTLRRGYHVDPAIDPRASHCTFQNHAAFEAIRESAQRPTVYLEIGKTLQYNDLRAGRMLTFVRRFPGRL